MICIQEKFISFLIGGSNTQGSLLTVEIIPPNCRPKISGVNIKYVHCKKGYRFSWLGTGKSLTFFYNVVNHYTFTPSVVSTYLATTMRSFVCFCSRRVSWRSGCNNPSRKTFCVWWQVWLFFSMQWLVLLLSVRE